MAGKGRIAKTAVTYAMKYGPLVYEAIKHGREPAQRAVQKALARQADRKRALTHATTVVDGSVLRVFHEAEPIWVVFSKDTPVASYPAVDVPLADVLQHADLSLRVTPPPPGSRRLPELDMSKLPKVPDLPALARKALRRGHR
ncbi:hypothetical protein ABN028_06495 [Actinopolymorpha sp. B17G11]|uniref:hypothetical protein n=1 Tax=unclassified Actinopolymorpha TaxID=2627063 RepID=UPI0032D8D7F8